jgi:hypothetical protein
MIQVVDVATRDGVSSTSTRGWGAVVRLGHGFANWETMGMRLVLAGTWSRYANESLVSAELGIEVQSF